MRLFRTLWPRPHSKISILGALPHLSVLSADLSSNMVDVFEIAPPSGASRGSSTSFAYAGQGARLARYQHLVSKLSADEDTPSAGVKVGWLADDDLNETTQVSKTPTRRTVGGENDALVGTFADAAAAAASTEAAVAAVVPAHVS